MIDRRELIQRATMALGGAISASAVIGVMDGCVASASPAPQRTKFFTPSEAKTVAVIAELIIPRTDTPGAIDVGVPAFIDRMMADYYQDRERMAVRAGLLVIDQDAHLAHAKTFIALTPDQQLELLKRYDREAYEQAHSGGPPGSDRHVFGALKELTTLGFFTSQVGASKILKYAPVPGPYHGDIPYAQVGGAWAI